METKESVENFKNEFYEYARLISKTSKEGEDLVGKIYSKKDYFNSLTPEARYEYMKTDPDFVALSDIKNKLLTYFAGYYNFMTANMVTNTQNQAATTSQPVAPPKDKAVIDSME